MSIILSDLPEVLSHMDDILIFSSNKAEHDAHLSNVLTRQQVGVTLNLSKCEFNVRTLRFLGHAIDARGIRTDPNKLAAIHDLACPTNITELRRFIGKVNQLGNIHRTLQKSVSHYEKLLSTTKRA